MRLARLVGGVSALLAGTALAAQGDALLVSGNNVNVRAGPSAEAGILTRVGANEPAVERRRQGQWVEVELPRQDVLGWIHGSLLTVAPAGPGQAEQPQAASGDRGRTTVAVGTGLNVGESDGTPLGRFRSEVAYFNNRALAVAGVDLFTGVVPLGESGVQVVTTEAWATMSEPGHQNYLNALFARWRAAAGADQPIRLEIIDQSGALMMEKSAP
jgi:uncharacterized protein YraI